MRLFVAVDLDESARAGVEALRRRLERHLEHGRSDLRWTDAGQLHLTLAFIGEVDEATGAAVAAAMHTPIAQAPYRLTLGGLGAFPPRGAPRVLWIGSSQGGRETIDLQREVAGRITGVGIELERRPFHAHLTLGRWRTAGERDRRTVVELADTGEVARVEVDHVTLYESRLSPHGATHTPLVVTPLRRSGPSE